MKKFSVNVYYQYELDIKVSAKNAREAKAKAHKRVAGRKIGQKSIRKDWTEVDEY